jgi:hypothetical protein
MRSGYGEYEGAGFPCGSLSTGNSSTHFGPYNWIQYTLETVGSFDVCGQWWVTTSATVAAVA